ncbi:MAG TPA: PKD domain-containing protein [Chitinophagaceae bacterium]|nr:PKD domain-containing protein [Chitinophagaceae bacterium]
MQNKGQWDSRVRYKGAVSNGAFFIRDKGFTMVQYDPVGVANAMQVMHEKGPAYEGGPLMVKTHAFHVDFIGASASVKMAAHKRIQAYNNYFSGASSNWASACEIFQVVKLENVYPNIDVRYYTENGFLKYDILVKPGGDVSDIALRYDGVDGLKVKNKELTIQTSVGELKESSPYTYQPTLTGKAEINTRYVVKDNVVTFDVKNYDRKTTLIIDPQVIFCSFSGSAADNWGYTATYGPDGSMYGGGIVHDDGFPYSTGAFETDFQGGGFDIGIIKLSPDGSNRVYATYIGGTGDEQPHSLIVDNQGNLIMAGRTNSPRSGVGAYPLTAAPTGSCVSYDIVITKLNAAGTALIGSRRIGGSNWDGVNISPTRGPNSLQTNYGDDGRSEVILDAAGNVYVASCTQSGDFPATASVFQGTLGGNQDGVVIKLNPDLSTILFASFLGGNSNDAAYVLSIAPNGNIYVAGGTESLDPSVFPGNESGTIGPTHNGGIDGFVCIITSNGAAALRSTYIGTTGDDQIYGIQFDKKGFPYITGQTTGDWRVVNNIPGSSSIYSSGGKQFIAKMQADLSAYVYSTKFGTGSTTPNISITAFLVDRCENVYVSGWGGFYGTNNAFKSAGTAGLPFTSDAIKTTTDGKDFYFFVLKRDATQQLFGSFFGETNNAGAGCDHVDGGTSRFDRNGVIYQAICANCRISNQQPLFPTTAGAWSTVNIASGAECNLAMLKFDLQLSGVDGEIRSDVNGGDTSGCVPFKVDFIDSIGNAQTYEWHFNYVPGNPPDLITSTPNATTTYNTIGVYRVLLVAVDPNSCNIRDSSFMNIRVGDVKATLLPAWQPIGPGCPKLTYEFINNSTSSDPTKPFQDTSFVWDFGDGSPRVQAKTGAANAVSHVYPGVGTYNAMLILKDTTYCNNPDDSTFLISIADNVKAIIETPANGCVPYTAILKSRSQNGVTFKWDFGDPASPDNTSILENPTHFYANPGTYTIRLTATNLGTCNVNHDTTFTITVIRKPVPDFITTPDPPLVNTPTTFTNLSNVDAVRFKWVFGDGDSVFTNSRAPVVHQYNKTATFNACLTAYNAAGCDSIICQQVRAIIDPLLDVPNAFTPLSGDENSLVMVRGFGIGKMTFTIWNRWGQKVFETNNRFQGWDGKVKGVVQPMDVYVYTLNVEFTDGTKTTKKGDLTLIR